MDLSSCPHNILKFASPIKTFEPLDATTLGKAQRSMIQYEGYDEADFNLLLSLGIDVNGIDPTDG